MANSEIRKSSVQAPQATDLFGAMRDEIDRVFDRFTTGWPGIGGLSMRQLGGEQMPLHLDVRDDGKAITIEADLPGINEKDISLTVNNGVLSIKGERKSQREEKKADYYLSERTHGSFQRSLRLPESIDEGTLKASFENGVLKVVAQKKPDAVKSEKRIEIGKS